MRGRGGWLQPNSHAYKVADVSNATCMILVLLFMENIGASEVASMNIQANTEDTQPFVSWIIVFAECEIIVKKCSDFIWAQSNLFGHGSSLETMIEQGPGGGTALESL